MRHLHPRVYSDNDETMVYCERGLRLQGSERSFYTELRCFVCQVADKPRSFSIWERDIRRANFQRFP
jgi:hypothetical protein